MDFQTSTTISPSSPSIILSVQNTDPINPVSIGGINFFVTVQAGGPTIDTNPGLGVDLLTGTVFSGYALGGQLPIGSEAPLSPDLLT
jgi:hypothetical protein